MPQEHPAAAGVILTALVAEGAIALWRPVPGERLPSLPSVICLSSVSVLGSAPDKLLHLGPCLSVLTLEPCHVDPWAPADSAVELSKTETLF